MLTPTRTNDNKCTLQQLLEPNSVRSHTQDKLDSFLLVILPSFLHLEAIHSIKIEIEDGAAR